MSHILLLDERAALKKANTRNWLLANSAGIGILDCDLETNSIESNEWRYRLYGLDHLGPKLSSPDVWLHRIHTEDRPAEQQRLRDALDDVRPYDAEFRIIWEDGSIHFLKASGHRSR